MKNQNENSASNSESPEPHNKPLRSRRIIRALGHFADRVGEELPAAQSRAMDQDMVTGVRLPSITEDEIAAAIDQAAHVAGNIDARLDAKRQLGSIHDTGDVFEAFAKTPPSDHQEL